MNLATHAQAYRILRDQLLERYPELAEDEDCLRDTLEGATTINDQLAALARSALNDEAMANGLAEYQVKLADRKRDLQLRALKKRMAVLNYMNDLNLKNVTAPDLAVTRKNVPPAVVITDEAALPDQFCRFKREPNKTAIKSALQDGKEVPGAMMGNGSETIMLKV